MKVTPAAVIAGLLAGTIVTIVSVSGASRRAAKVAPVEAMRSGIIDRKVGVTGVVNRLVGLAIGVLLLVWGSFLGGPGWILGVGALVFAISVLRCGGVLARVAAKAARPLVRRVGVEGRLAADNIDRSAKRAATTANALVIGVLLITLVTTAGGTLKKSLLDQVDSLSTADITVITQGGGLPEPLLQQMRDVRGVETLAVVRITPVTINANQVGLSTADPTELLRATGLDVLDGSVEDLGDDGIAAIGAKPGETNQCSDDGVDPKMGDRQDVTLVDGTVETFTVKALLECKLDFSTFVLGHLVSPGTFERIAGDVPASQAFIRVDGRSAAAVTDDLERLTDEYPQIAVVEGNFIGQILENVFDFLIAGVNGLLGMSVFIAIIGIVNTMTLSVLERRRDRPAPCRRDVPGRGAPAWSASSR